MKTFRQFLIILFFTGFFSDAFFTAFYIGHLESGKQFTIYDSMILIGFSLILFDMGRMFKQDSMNG